MLTSPNHKTDGCHCKWEETCTHSHGASCLSPSSFSLLPSSSPGCPSPLPHPPGSLCFICNLINSSEVEPLTLTRHLPVHMATGWPPSHTPLRLRDTQWPLQPTANPVTWVIWHTSTQTHNRSGNLVSAVWFKVALLDWKEGKLGCKFLCRHWRFLMRRCEDLQVQRDQRSSIGWAS